MEKESRWTQRDKNGKAYFKPMNPDCNSCDGCKFLSCCMDRWSARLADLEDRDNYLRAENAHLKNALNIVYSMADKMAAKIHDGNITREYDLWVRGGRVYPWDDTD